MEMIKNMLEYGSNSAEVRKMRGGRVSMIFQEPMTSLNPVLTVGFQIQENIIEHLHLSKEDAKKRAIEMMKMVNIPDAEERFCVLSTAVFRWYAPEDHDRNGDVF